MTDQDITMKSDSDDSDSEDSVDHESELANIEIFKRQLLEDSRNYETHVGLIKSLRKIGELEELRKAHEEMNKIYPLSPELWLQWLSDEKKICTSAEERKSIIQLFKRAVKEYMGVQLWVEYIIFMLGGGNIEETRKVCEEALTAVGIHIAEGILIWQAVILVEQQHFLALSQDDDKAIEEQKKRIQNLYRRQARVPLMNQNKEVFLEEAEKWFDGEVDIQIRKDFDNSLKKVLEKLPYEEALLNANDEVEKLEAYRKYLDFVRATDTPTVIQNLYERTVTDLCLNEGIWEEYVRYLLENLSTAHYTILPVCERSQANCPWSSTLYELHITALQMFAETIGEDQAYNKIKAATEKTLVNEMTEIELIKTWMAYLVYLRRRIKWDDEECKYLKEFRQSCDTAISSIDERLEDEGDKECTVARFQARVEAESAKNMEKARTLWNDVVMKRDNNFKKANLWLEFINLERCYGTEKHCRKLYRRAVERVWDDIEVIGSSFLQFEQEVGTLETMGDFEKRYKVKMSIVQKRRMEEAMKEEAKKEQSKGKGKKKEKHQPGSDLRSKGSWNEEESTKYPQISPTGKKRKISEAEGKPDAPPGYEKYKVKQDTKKQKVTDHGEFVEHDRTLDHRTVFLSNMDYNAKEEEVLEIFKDCGEVENLRIVKDYKGRSKGFAYLLFTDGSSVSKALMKDRVPLCTRPLFVSRCDPENREHAFKFPTGLEKEKLFVRGLPVQMNEEKVKKLFETYGEVKSIRLVTHRNGHSKGICYIEYHDAQTAENVRQKTDGMEVEERKISVVISNPSTKKNENFTQKRLPTQVPPTGSRQRNKLSLVPRALLRNSAGPSKEGLGNGTANGKDENAESSSNGTASVTPKSNEDFRKMFFK